MKKDRSSSGGALEFPSSPSVSRRSHREKQPSYSRLRLNPNTVTPAQIAELTIFHIPGLDVKVNQSRFGRCVCFGIQGRIEETILGGKLQIFYFDKGKKLSAIK